MMWRRKRRPGATGGQEARERAEMELERTRAETPYYERLNREASVLRIENHIADNVFAAIRGR